MIDVPAHEQDHVRVFALNGDQDLNGVRQTYLSQVEGSADLPEPGYLAALLGAPEVDPSYIEFFPASDVAEMGLTSYLRQALDVTEDSSAADRGKLDALQGYVLIVLSAAFGGRATRLTPGSDLTLVGTYPTEALAPSTATPLPASKDAAMPPPDTVATSGQARLGSSTIAVIVVIALIVAVVVLLAVSGGPS